MKRVLVYAALSAIVAGVAVPALADGATAALPTLTGETLFQQSDAPQSYSAPPAVTPSVKVNGSCLDPNVTMTYNVTGTTTGNYAGTYTDVGTVTFTSSTLSRTPQPDADGEYGSRIGTGTLAGDFTVTGSNGTVTGH